MMSNAEFNEEQHQLELAAKDAEIERERNNADNLRQQVQDQAAEIERLRATLAAIAALDPAVDSKDGFNEWGEADCFNKAQAMAREALSARPNVPVKPPEARRKNTWLRK